jgi:hypothetical protein
LRCESHWLTFGISLVAGMIYQIATRITLRKSKERYPFRPQDV